MSEILTSETSIVRNYNLTLKKKNFYLQQAYLDSDSNIGINYLLNLQILSTFIPQLQL